MLEYADASVTDGAVAGLNGLRLGDYVLSVQRIPKQMADVLLQNTPGNVSPSSARGESSPTTVLRLSNMVTVQDLTDAASYEELLADVTEECNNYGAVKTVVIPRKTTTGDPIPSTANRLEGTRKR